MPQTRLLLKIAQTWDGQAIEPDHAITLVLEVDGDELQVEVDAPLHGDPPPEAPPGPTDQLWNYEVVELFIAGQDGTYTEIELGPHHLVLQLRSVRVPVATMLPIRYRTELHGDRWSGQATIPLQLLPAGPHRINATAIHGAGPDRTYLSMVPLPGRAPDFHQPDRFSVQASLI